MSKILIVEDEVAIADLEKDYLELCGFAVEIETDGETRAEACPGGGIRSDHSGSDAARRGWF